MQNKVSLSYKTTALFEPCFELRIFIIIHLTKLFIHQQSRNILFNISANIKRFSFFGTMSFII